MAAPKRFYDVVVGVDTDAPTPQSSAIDTQVNVLRVAQLFIADNGEEYDENRYVAFIQADGWAFAKAFAADELEDARALIAKWRDRAEAAN
jgi:hypothetical protein